MNCVRFASMICAETVVRCVSRSHSQLTMPSCPKTCTPYEDSAYSDRFHGSQTSTPEDAARNTFGRHCSISEDLRHGYELLHTEQLSERVFDLPAHEVSGYGSRKNHLGME